MAWDGWADFLTPPAIAGGLIAGSLLLLALFVATAVWIARLRPSGLFGGLVVACAYLPVSHLLFTVPYVVAERYLYLPMVGVAIVLAAGLVQVLASRVDDARRRRAAVVCVVAGEGAAVRNERWQEPK